MSPVLSLIALSAANSVFLAAANGGADSGKYKVEIRGESAIDADQVTARLDKRLLTLYVAGAKVRADNRAWGQGADRVKAHRHEGKVELEVGLPSGCGGRVNIAAAGDGVVLASVSCPTLVAGTPATKRDVVAAPKAVAPPKAVAAELVKAAPLPQNKVAAEPTVSEADALLAAVALAKPAPAAKVDEPATEPKAEVATTPPTVEPAPANVTPPAAPTQASLWGAAMKALIPVLMLGGLAMFGLRFAKKRRAVGRHVKILETTQLGPKRSLIVAKVGNETLLLGASEAGIALIQVRPSGALDDSPRGDTQDDEVDISPKWADVLPADFRSKPANNDEEGGQATMLSRLFRKRRQDIPEAWPFANVLDASLMEESVEDRELREKLAMGMEARVR